MHMHRSHIYIYIYIYTHTHDMYIIYHFEDFNGDLEAEAAAPSN